MLDIAKRKAMLRQMILLRAFEEKLEELYQRKAMFGSTHSYRGQEAIAVGVCSALQRTDLIASYHRGTGHLIAKGADLYQEYLDQLVLAAKLGFDGVCVNEHHQNAYGLMPSPNVIAGALTQRTKKCKIAVIGNALPMYNPPLRVAEEFAMLDVMSGGRLVAEAAFESVRFIVTEVSFGWLIRGIHSWSANLMVLAAFLFMRRMAEVSGIGAITPSVASRGTAVTRAVMMFRACPFMGAV